MLLGGTPLTAADFNEKGPQKSWITQGHCHGNTVSLVQKGKKKTDMTAVSSDVLNQLLEEQLKIRSF